MKTISLVMPFYNEGEMVEGFFAKLLPIINNLPQYNFELICVDDGSKDDTFARLNAINDRRQKIILFSRNFRKEAALTAGIDFATGDAVIPIDTDLQDPPELIPTMLKKWEEGFEAVLAKRKNRQADSWFKRTSAKYFYKIHQHLSDFIIPENVGDFRLMDKLVVAALKKLPERQRFMKGIFAWVGFNSATIEYDRPERDFGTSKWKWWQLWNFAIDGITSFSTLPLRIWSYLGFTFAMIAFIYGTWIILRTLFSGVDLPGYASLFTAILFIGGVQMIGIGVLGEYLGRTYQETKQRPVYIIKKIVDKTSG